ncbi:TonB-dependent receptor [Asticcacaulis sp. DXS10W]|uniref:TonB-dependent receptor n=1 Tax=Asticcacaulis currens TaxID=2984210 RepID=A0ABT5IBJ0_9CAUL|nr:TonB-dependent receptor [Asticcacaulis currens]MDC7693561.1 TonB-dependent receptor [Asticcacaulis currens]
MKLEKFLALTAAMAPIAAVAVPVVVQAAEAEEVTEVVVKARKPLAESDAAALKAQRQSDSLVSVLSADDAGNLPDQNIAFAIGRLPGVGLERDQGQARYVNLRGMPRRWATISFDGLSVVSAEGRDSRFDNIPSAIASQVTIQKAIVPSMPGDTVAGNIDIRTRRAFDYKGQKITGKLGLGHVTLGGGEEIDSNLVYSNIFLGGKLGIVAQGSYYRRNMATENWETDPYLPAVVADQGRRFAREFEYKNYRLTRYNSSFSTRADYRFDDKNTIFASLIATVFKDDELRDNWIVRLDQGTNAAGVRYDTAAVQNASDPKSGISYGARLNSRIDYRDSEEILATSTIGGEHRDWYGFDVSWRLNYTLGKNGGDTPVSAAYQSPSTFTDRPTAVYDFRNGDQNMVRLFRTTGTTSARTQGERILSAEQFPMLLQQFRRDTGGEDTQALTAKIDFDRQTDVFGHSTKLEFGALTTSRTKKNNVERYEIVSGLNSSGVCPASGAPANSFCANGIAIPSWGDLAIDDPYKGRQPLGYTFRYTNQPYTNALMDSYINKGAATRQAGYSADNYWMVKEFLTAGYIMATTQFDWGNIVYGTRVESIENKGQAYSSALSKFVNTSSDNTLVYPSVHLNWNVTDRLKARFSLNRTASRPDYDDLRPSFTYKDGDQTISGGNPNAKPEKQTGFDAYLEYYGETGFLSAGFFHKDLEDVLFNQSGTFGSDILNSGNTDRSSYILTTLRNGGKGKLSGVELFASQSAEKLVEGLGWPEWMGGFGVKASATLADSEITIPAYNIGTKAVPVIVPERKADLPGTSDGVYNLQLIYEKYGLTVRLAYQYRTAWIQDIGSSTIVNGVAMPADNGDIYWDEDEEVDLSVRYQINNNLEWFFDGSNLRNQGARRYGGTSIYPIEFEKFGPRYVAGLRFNF